MSAMMKSVMGTIGQFANPAMYKAYYAEIIKTTHKDIRAGSARPLFKAMLVVGLTGYTMEYGLVGRHHVMDRQAIVKKAMAEHAH